jgi:3-dehydroquinate dehydratase type I
MNEKLNICLAIPISSLSLKENRILIERAISKNPDFIELRFDYISDVKVLSLTLIKNLMKSVKIPFILTFRKNSEGGNSKLNTAGRLEIIRKFIASKPDFIDIEIDNEVKFLKEIFQDAIQNNIKLIFSSHNFKETPLFEEASESIRSSQNFITKEIGIDSAQMKNIIFKMIFTAKQLNDNFTPLRLCRQFYKTDQKLISFVIKF